MTALIRDLRYAARAARRQRGASAAAIAALALGIGAATALFSVVRATVLAPLPYAQPDRLVTILHGTAVDAPVSPADYFDLRAASRSFAGMAAAQAWGANLDAGGRTERVRAMQVSADLFDVLGVPAAVGRAFAAGEDSPAHAGVVVLSDGAWTARFGRDPSVVGRTLRLNGEPYTVIGVMPPAFRFAPFWQTRPELWVPLVLDARRADRSGRSLRLFARLRDGVSLDAARAELHLIFARLAAAYPDTDTGLTIGAALLADKASGDIRPVVLGLFGLAMLVLLIACLNTATMTLARALGRSQELAIRTALGAGSRELVRLLLAEGVVLGMAGAAIGLALARGALAVMGATLPTGSLPPHATLELSAWGTAFAVIAGLAAGLVTSLAAAWHAARRDVSAAARDGSRTATAGRGARTRAVLVASEVAVTFVLIAAAGLLAHTLVNLRAIDVGFRSDGAAAISVSLEGTAAAAPDRQAQFVAEVLAALRGRPGVQAAGAINHLPLAGDLWTLSYWVDGAPRPRPGEELGAAYRVVTPGYFAAMGQALVAGRPFGAADRPDTPPVVIVNETLARRHWGDGRAIGGRLIVPGVDDDLTPMTIVGIVADARQRGLTTAPEDEVYLPLPQRPGATGRSGLTLVARAAGDSAALVAEMRTAVWRADRSAAVYDGMTLDEVLDRELWRQSFASDLAALFALTALALAAVGIHGVVAYGAARRTREFGVRLALGARAADVRWIAVRDAVAPVGAGLAVGGLVALLLPRVLGPLLYSVSGHDPLVLAGGAALLLAAAGWAGWMPARRAGRLDPAAVLRDE